MAETIAAERRLLTEAEFDAVSGTHYPEICGMEKDELISLARRVREYRDKARDVTRQRRREQRGKAAPRGANPAPSEVGTARKKQIFASALKRLNRQIGRLDELGRRPSQGEIAHRALEMKRANQVRHHPSAGRTARRGMRSLPNQRDTVRVDPIAHDLPVVATPIAAEGFEWTPDRPIILAEDAEAFAQAVTRLAADTRGSVSASSRH